MTILDRIRTTPMTPARLVREHVEGTGGTRKDVSHDLLQHLAPWGPLQLCTDGLIRERGAV